MTTLLNIGPAKNGTTSVFNFLGKHPEIELSITKEPLMEGYSMERPDEYYSLWRRDNKVWLDGTPGFFTKAATRFSIETAKSLKFDEIKLIYLIRPHFKYFISTMINMGTKIVMLLPEHYLYSNVLERTAKRLGKENIFVIRLDKVEEKQSEIWKFLNVDDDVYKYKLPVENESFIKDEMAYIKWSKRLAGELKYGPLSNLISEDRERLKNEWNIQI